MARWVRALAAQARVAEVRCQSPSSKQGPAHSRQVETGGGLAQMDCQLKRTCKLWVQQRGFAPKKQYKSEKKIPTPLASMCSCYAAHIHITAAIKVWMEIFCMGGPSSSQKAHVYLHENPSSGFPVSCWSRRLLWLTKQYTLLPLLTVASRTVRPCC